jgi:hypothetical protein
MTASKNAGKRDAKGFSYDFVLPPSVAKAELEPRFDLAAGADHRPARSVEGLVEQKPVSSARLVFSMREGRAERSQRNLT